MQKSQQPKQVQPKYIQPEQVPELLKKPRSIMLDVRSYDYNEGGHMDFGTHFSVDDLEKRIDELRDYDIICTYCRYSQQRGPFAAIFIMEHFPNKQVFVIKGGFCNLKTQFPDSCIPNPEEIIGVSQE